MRKRITVLLSALCLFFVMPLRPSAALADLTPTAEQEISHLLDYVETCGCQFCRNDTWIDDMKAARQHAELKYRYFLRKGRIHSAEDFITWAASKSEMSGKPYLVRCGSASPQLTAQWLTQELHRFRDRRPPPSRG